jgi:ABC-2 type transport system ATP-binding protein
MRVAEMIGFMGELRGLTRADAKTRTTRWLERLGLGQWHSNKVADLSKGMQQKVQFACALIHQPELVILDEPWSGLDPINADVLRDIVRQERDRGATVLFSTHLMEQAEQICEQICIIARGKKVLDGRLAELKRAAATAGRVALGFVDAAAAARAAPVLADASLVAGPVRRDPTDPLVAELDVAPAVAPQRLLAALVAAEVGLARFEHVTPSLHTMFVDAVGRTAAEVAERREVA